MLLAMKIFCNLSISDQYVVYMVKFDLLKNLVPYITDYDTDLFLTELSIKLITNFGACQVDEDLIQQCIRETGCHEFIVQCIDNHITDSVIIILAMECLYNISCNVIPATTMDWNYHVHNETICRIFSLLDFFHYDLDVLKVCLKVASLFTLSTSSLSTFTKLGGVQVITRLLLSHVHNGGEIIERATLCLANITLTVEGRKILEGLHILKLLEECITFNSKSVQTCTHVLFVFSILGRETRLDISHHALYMLRNAAESHVANVMVLSFFIELIMQMSRNKEQTAGIIQSGCILLLFRVLDKASPQNQKITQATLQILWNLMVYSDESWSMVISAGLEAAVERNLCKVSHPNVRTMAYKVLAAIHDRRRCQSKISCLVSNEQTNKERLLSINKDSIINI